LGAGCDGRNIAERNFCATSGGGADGEIVWFWRSNAGAKSRGVIREVTVAKKPVTGKITYKP
jgi:hypothetical protein